MAQPSVLQCVAVCYSVLQCVTVRCSVLQCVAVCCSVSQCFFMAQPSAGDCCEGGDRLWMSHGTHVNHSWNTYEWVMSHIWMSHATHVNESYGVATMSRRLKIISLFCKRALLKRRYSAKETYHFKEPTNRSHPIICLLTRRGNRFWMSHGTHVNESWHTCEWIMAHMWMSHGTHVNESWHTHE